MLDEEMYISVMEYKRDYWQRIDDDIHEQYIKTIKMEYKGRKRDIVK